MWNQWLTLTVLLRGICSALLFQSPPFSYHPGCIKPSSLMPIPCQLAGLRIRQSRKPNQRHSQHLRRIRLSEPHEAARTQIVSHLWNFKYIYIWYIYIYIIYKIYVYICIFYAHVCAWNRPSIACVVTSFLFAESRSWIVCVVFLPCGMAHGEILKCWFSNIRLLLPLRVALIGNGWKETMHIGKWYQKQVMPSPRKKL